MDIHAYNKNNGRYIATWHGSEGEVPPTAMEAWDELGAAFPLVLVTDEGQLHSQMDYLTGKKY